jgi:Ser/Thr protein kinase RdoA (MazF antagonist)
MHKLSTTYQPKDPAWKRPEWNDPIHHDVEQFIPDQDQQIKSLFRDTIRTIQSLRVESSGYGLIHQDPHQGNFFVDDDGCLTFFDFDDCSYSWFVEDIALVLFYAVMGKEDPQVFTRDFLQGFMPGYFSAFTLDLDWFKYIPLFMKMRELDLYAVIHRSFDVDRLEDPWSIWYLDGRKERLEQGIPYLEFDFQSFDFSHFV